MIRLPVPGGDEDIWGEVLNEFLVVGHNDDGTIKTVDNINGVTINGTPDTNSVLIADDTENATWQQSPYINGNDYLYNTGDLITYSNGIDRLPIGSEGAILTVDSNSSFGMSWIELPTAINGITSTGAITVDNSDPVNPVIGFDASNIPGLFPLNGHSGQSLMKMSDDTIGWGNTNPRLSPKIVQYKSSDGGNLFGPTNIVATLDDNPVVGNTLVLAIFLRSSGSTMSEWSTPATGWSKLQDIKTGNCSLITGIKTVDSTSNAIDLGDFVSMDGNSAFAWALYEFSGMSSTDPIGFTYTTSGADPIQSHMLSPRCSVNGGVGLVVLGNLSVGGGFFTLGNQALPEPANIDTQVQGSYCGIGAYAIDLNNSTEFIGSINGVPGNSGNNLYAGLVMVLQGDLLTSTISINPNNNSSSSRDSRISLATGDTNALLDTFGNWVHVGVDTANWRYMHGNTPGNDLAGTDFELASDGSGVNVLHDCTIMVRLAFQISTYSDTNLAYAAPTYAVTHGSGFPGLISGDGDPISQAVNGSNQDLIFNWTWRVAAGSKLEFSVGIRGNTTDQHTDGFCLDIVRIA